jgi:hypothetical protein
MEKKKLIAIGVIFLFIGVAVAPSINFTVVKASQDDDLVEVTTQACGITGFGDTTVKLTREKYQNLERYLVEFRERLNKTSTRAEAVPIFKEAVVELDKYGLLPKGMSVEKAQKLVIQQKQNDYLTELQKRFHNNRILLNDDENYFSLIAGATTNTWIVGPIPLTCLVTGIIGANLFIIGINSMPPSIIVMGIGVLMLFSSLFVGLLFYLLPVILFSLITIGVQAVQFDPEAPTKYIPSDGWISSYGIAGKKMWNGPFYGNISGFIGVVGFTGFKIALLNNCFYLGSAIKVGISPNPPD